MEGTATAAEQQQRVEAEHQEFQAMLIQPLICTFVLLIGCLVTVVRCALNRRDAIGARAFADEAKRLSEHSI